MLVSLGIDLLAEEQGAAGFASFTARLRDVDVAAPDVVIFGGEQDGAVIPGRLEGLVNLPWAAGQVRSVAVVAALPALHGVPFHVARALSAIDFLSDRRAGWMPVCGNRDAFDRAYGAHHAIGDAAAKYDDFVRATQALWDSWDQDALILDKASGVYLDSAKVRRVDYRGDYFVTMGPLNAARPPQGHPLLVRDVDDLSAASAEPADIALLGATSVAEAEAAIVRLRAAPGTAHAKILVKTARLPLDAAASVAGADGVHLSGLPDAVAVAAARAALPATAQAGATARARLGLSERVNPFTQKALV
jgi:alkanesulfonate monooxygenase SsuD/methylene tetrahydromethanopterin reductase-like flavin-dependent oxidoreductase (luciferase family)